MYMRCPQPKPPSPHRAGSLLLQRRETTHVSDLQQVCACVRAWVRAYVCVDVSVGVGVDVDVPVRVCACGQRIMDYLSVIDLNFERLDIVPPDPALS